MEGREEGGKGRRRKGRKEKIRKSGGEGTKE